MFWSAHRSSLRSALPYGVLWRKGEVWSSCWSSTRTSLALHEQRVTSSWGLALRDEEATRRKETELASEHSSDAVRARLVTKKPITSDISLSGVLGSGAFGVVRLGRFLSNGEQCAVKVLRKEDNPWCFKELDMSSRVRHTNCQKMLACYEDSQHVYIVNELYTGGELFDYIAHSWRDGSPFVANPHAAERRAFTIISEVLASVEMCHRAGFAHLDVKPENFVFKQKRIGSQLVLIDFGSAEPFQKAAYAETAKEYVPGEDDELVTLNRITGTALYMSPEVAQGEFSSRSDVWSVGVILYALLSGNLPFSLRSTTSRGTIPSFDATIFDEIDIFDHVSTTGRDILMHMLEMNPAFRLSATEAQRRISMHLSNDLINFQ